eukprot:gene25455-223_t
MGTVMRINLPSVVLESNPSATDHGHHSNDLRGFDMFLMCNSYDPLQPTPLPPPTQDRSDPEPQQAQTNDGEVPTTQPNLAHNDADLNTSGKSSRNGNLDGVSPENQKNSGYLTIILKAPSVSERPIKFSVDPSLTGTVIFDELAKRQLQQGKPALYGHLEYGGVELDTSKPLGSYTHHIFDGTPLTLTFRSLDDRHPLSYAMYKLIRSMFENVSGGSIADRAAAGDLCRHIEEMLPTLDEQERYRFNNLRTSMK